MGFLVDTGRLGLRIKSPDFSRSLGEGDRCSVEVVHKSSDGAYGHDGLVTVSGSVFRSVGGCSASEISPNFLSRLVRRGAWRLRDLGSWWFESIRPSGVVSVVLLLDGTAFYGWPATFVGTELAVVVPSPSWPLAFPPQQ
jgi:hypothetical protein